MVRDLMIDIKERDLLVEDKSDVVTPVFDSIWGNLFDEDQEVDALICNILIPEAYQRMVGYEDGEMTCRFTTSYMPDTNHFRIRLVAMSNGEYSLFGNIRGNFGLPVSSYALNKNIAAPIAACMLPYIDIDGEFIVRLVKNEKYEALDKAYIYSSKVTDIDIDFSDSQASQLLSLNGPGNYYRFPTTGVGITKYLNGVVSHSDLEKKLEEQFEADGKPIHDASFDNTSCDLDILASPEPERSDTDLEDVSSLDMNFFELHTDEYVRRNVVLTELADVDFLKLINDYERILNIIIFQDSTTSAMRIDNNVVSGKFNTLGEIVDSDEYYIVSATLDADTIVMFDDEMENDVKDAPIFIINDNDETRLYTSLIEQPYWLTESCHKCFVLKHRATVRYMIRQDQFRKDKGLYIIPQVSENIKNMLGLVQDVHTGRILGIVSSSTNISDITLDEITQHIYATHINN